MGKVRRRRGKQAFNLYVSVKVVEVVAEEWVRRGNTQTALSTRLLMAVMWRYNYLEWGLKDVAIEVVG